MKTVKRIFAVLLTVCMVLGMTVSAAAGGAGPATTGTLTITQAIPNATYSVYKMLDVMDVTFDDTHPTEVTSSVYYLAPGSAWLDFFVATTPTDGNYTADGVRDYVEVTKVDGDNNYYVEWIATTTNASGATVIDDAKAEAFAGLALAYAKDTSHSVTAAVTKQAQPPTDQSETTSSVVFDNLPFGYYLVDTNGGSVVALDTFAAEQTIEEKNSAPTLEKKVRDVRSETTDSGEKWEDTNTANIGDTVTFKTTITVGAGAINYILHDAMSEGLTFKEVSKVELYKNISTNADSLEYGDTPTLVLTKSADGVTDYHYEVKTTPVCSGTIKATPDATAAEACDFEVVFNQDIFAKDGFNASGTSYTITEGDRLVVTYTATLNEKAVIAEAGNPNRTILTYGDTPVAGSDPLKTPQDETTTYTYEFDLVKTNKKDEVIDGAQFELRPAGADGNYDADTDIIKFEEVKNDANEVIGYKVSKTGTIEKIPAGKATVTGLGKGKYYLTEITAPDGYKKLTDPVGFEINNANITAETTTENNGDGNTVEKLSETNTGVQVINVKKSIFPHTGGMGTTMYYLAGGAIVALVAALAVIILKKGMRRAAKSE